MPTFTDDDISTAQQIIEPGTYLAEVESVKEKKTKNGDYMIAVGFKLVETGDHLCWDNLVFEGRGFGIAASKAKALGVEKDEHGNYSFEAGELKGLRAMLTVKEREYQGKTTLEPDFNAEGFGYKPAVLKSDVPF